MSENRIYNEDIKEQFLSTLPEGTAKIYRYAFYRSFDLEDMLQRDIFEMNTDSVLDIVKSANHSTLNSIKLTFNVFEKYTTWAAEHGYKSTNINQLSTVTVKELEKYLDKNKKLFLSEDEIIELEDSLVNAQDKVILRLIFEGALGYKNSELINLTFRDIDWDNNKIKVKDDKTNEIREITVSDRCLRLIESALNEKEYQPKNGTVEIKRGVFKVLDGEYVIRNTRTGDVGSEDGKGDTHTIYRRMNMMKEFFGYPYLTPKNLRASGMLKMGKDLYERDGKLENEQLAEIAQQFGVKKTNISGYVNYHFSYLKEIINADNIMDLYGVNIEE